MGDKTKSWDLGEDERIEPPVKMLGSWPRVAPSPSSCSAMSGNAVAFGVGPTNWICGFEFSLVSVTSSCFFTSWRALGSRCLWGLLGPEMDRMNDAFDLIDMGSFRFATYSEHFVLKNRLVHWQKSISSLLTIDNTKSSLPNQHHHPGYYSNVSLSQNCVNDTANGRKVPQLTIIIRKYRINCCHVVNVDRLTVDNPVTVIAE